MSIIEKTVNFPISLCYILESERVARANKSFFTDGMHCLGSCFILDLGVIVKFKCMKCGPVVY